MMKFRILAALALLTSQSAAASEWYKVSTYSSGSRSIDRDSIVKSPDGLRRAWHRDDLNDGKSTKGFLIYDCANRASMTISLIDYSKTGDVLFSQTIPVYARKWEFPAPDTVGDAVFSFVCSV